MNPRDGVLLIIFIIIIIGYFINRSVSKCPKCGRQMRDEIFNTGYISDGNSVTGTIQVCDYCTNKENDCFNDDLKSDFQDSWYQKYQNNGTLTKNTDINDNYDNIAEKLKILKKLKKDNLISEEEFEEKKKKLVNQL